MGYIRITVLQEDYDDANHSFAWLSWNTPISFRRTKRLVMEEDYPQLGDIPIEQFESLESLELVGGADIRFLLLQPYRLTLSGALVVPFPTLLELQITSDASLSLGALAGVLMERKQAGYGVKTVRIRGECAEPIEELISKVKEFVGELVLDT